LIDVDRLAILNQQITKLKMEADLIKDSLKDYCSSNNVQKVYGMIHSVTYVEANAKLLITKLFAPTLNWMTRSLANTPRTTLYTPSRFQHDRPPCRGIEANAPSCGRINGRAPLRILQ
jgi:hypothetical protein